MRGPWASLADVANAKGHPTHTQSNPQLQLKTPGSGRGGWVPQLCLPPGAQGTLHPMGMELRRGKAVND